MELSLFPLSSVLLPFGRMPLQIFERRYVDLVRDSMRSGDGFGIVRIESGQEVGADDSPVLAPVGTVARIADWDQLDNGLLGITVAGEQRFQLHRHWRDERGLNIGEVDLLPAPPEEPLREEWSEFADLLKGLEAHPHVQRIGMTPDYTDAWQVAYALLQLLPLDEGFKATVLALDGISPVMDALEEVLGELGGETQSAT